MKIATPPTLSPPLSQQPPLKVEVLSSPVFEDLVGGSPPLPPPPPAERRGAYYVLKFSSASLNIVSKQEIRKVTTYLAHITMIAF